MGFFDNTAEFIDTMDAINNIAKNFGFDNGRNWVHEAFRCGEISARQHSDFANACDLRNIIAHGNARDINVTYEKMSVVMDFEKCISSSFLRNNRYGKNGGGNSKHAGGPKLPKGTFRAKPFIKEFTRNGFDGEQYFFRLEIRKENNYLDDGFGGNTGFGFFIHVLDAPYLQFTSDMLHEFHMIRADTGFHICWNKIINSFQDANAVMYVWVNRYAKLLDDMKKNRFISENKLVAKADKKRVLPSGTFRGKADNHNPKASAKKMKTVLMTQKVYGQIMEVLGKKKPELGGMLGFSSDRDTIDSYVFDAGAKVNSTEYNPNIEYLQSVLDGEWEKKNISLGGFVHSHPGDFDRLSWADVEYAQRIMEAFELGHLFMPIVTSSYEHVAAIKGYVVRSDGRVERCDIKVVPDDWSETKEKSEQKKFFEQTGQKVKIEEKKMTDTEDRIDEELLKRIEAGFDCMDKKRAEKTAAENGCTDDSSPASLSQNDTFARIRDVIDIEYMSECAIIGIGCGGSRSFYESMARIGVGKFYLIDGDKASRSNIASQNGYLSEIGMFKPELIKKRLLDINEDANVTCFNRMLTNELDDSWLENEILGNIDCRKAVICAFTDDFFAQARADRIAKKYRIPFISGQHHSRGLTSEIVYWYPDITKYSLSEIAKTRYEDYENGYENTVTSVGSPIFNTTRLNALCEKIAAGLLLYGKAPDHLYCKFLNRDGGRNLILIKQGCIDGTHDLYGLFENGAGSLFDEAEWIDPSSLEDLENVEHGACEIKDTRDIFGKNKTDLLQK